MSFLHTSTHTSAHASEVASMSVHCMFQLWSYVHYSTSKRFSRKKKSLHFMIIWPCIITDSLWIKPTDAPYSNFIGIMTLHVLGSLSAHHQEFSAIHRLWYILCGSDDRLLPEGARSSILLLVANGHHNQSRCTAENSWWWAERLPETCRVIIPIKLEFGASVGLFTRKALHV